AQRRCGGLAAHGARAAGRPRAAQRRADVDGRRRPGSATACRRVRKWTAGAGVAGWTRPADRVSLGGERQRSLAPQRGRVGAHAPDLILATSTPVMAALREQGLSVPIMFVQVTDPVGQGLVPNLARPGGHITGFINFEFSIGTKWLETLKQIAPRVTRVALIYNPETAPHADLFQRP